MTKAFVIMARRVARPAQTACSVGLVGQWGLVGVGGGHSGEVSGTQGPFDMMPLWFSEGELCAQA